MTDVVDQQAVLALERFLTVMRGAFGFSEATLHFTASMPISVVDMSRSLKNIVAGDAEDALTSRVPLMFPMGQDLGPGFVDDLLNAMTALGAQNSALLFVFPFIEQPLLDRQRSILIGRVRKYGHDIVIMGREDLVRILAAPVPLRELRSFVLSQIDLTKVAPYREAGPVPDHVFFGREAELSGISQSIRTKSFIVIGGRRIGKSSLLGRLHRVVLPQADFRTVFYDCEADVSMEDFMNSKIEDWRPSAPDNAPSTIAELIESPPVDLPLVVLLDEADSLIPEDRAAGWKTFKTLRSIAERPGSRCQFVLTGSRALREAIQGDVHGPFYNFGSELVLGCLDFPAVEQIVIQPMRQLEVILADEAKIVRTVYDFTSGHPNVVQRLCIRLIAQLNKQGTRRVTLDDVNAVIEDPSFQRNDFLSTFWVDATPLEEIISLLMAENASVHTLQTVRKALVDRCGINVKAREVDGALQRLVDLRAILKRIPTGYTFAAEAFPRVVAGTITLQDMLEILAEEYKERNR